MWLSASYDWINRITVILFYYSISGYNYVGNPDKTVTLLMCFNLLSKLEYFLLCVERLPLSAIKTYIQTILCLIFSSTRNMQERTLLLYHKVSKGNDFSYSPNCIASKVSARLGYNGFHKIDFTIDALCFIRNALQKVWTLKLRNLCYIGPHWACVDLYMCNKIFIT